MDTQTDERPASHGAAWGANDAPAGEQPGPGTAVLERAPVTDPLSQAGPLAGWNGATPSASRVALGRRGVWGLLGGLALVILLLVSFAAVRAAGLGSAGATSSLSTGATSGSSSVALPATAQDLQQTIIADIHSVQPSVVEVTSSGGSGEAIGSGVIVTKDGYITTNDHVVQGYSSYKVTLANGQSLAARLVGEDAQHDLAVLKVAASNLQPISFADSSTVQVGQFAVAIGTPLGLDQSATLGIVSALNRTEQEDQGVVLSGLVQTSAPINPGNSGGALVDLQGRLIGIPTLGATSGQTGASADGIGFAIPASRVQTVTTQLITQSNG